MTEVTLTELRRDIFRLIDRALDGEEIVVRRRGRRVVIRPDAEERPLTHAEKVDRWIGDARLYDDLTPEERVEVDAEIAAEEAVHRGFQDAQHAAWLAKWDARLADDALPEGDRAHGDEKA